MPGEFSLSLYIYVVDETKVYCELVRKQTALSIGSDYCAPTRSSLLCILKSFFVVGAGFYCDNFHLLESSTHSTHSETPNYKHLHSRRGRRQHKRHQAHHTHKGCHPSPTRQATQSESSGSFSSQPPSRSAPQCFHWKHDGA